MEYQAGVLISSIEEESFGDYYEANHFRPLRPVRESLTEVMADLLAVKLWIRRQTKQDAKFHRRYGPYYREDSWNWPQGWVDDDSFESEALPMPSYEIHIRVADTT